MDAAPLQPQSIGTASSATAMSGSKTRTWTASLTVVCFLFGGLLALQLRAYEKVQAARENKVAGDAMLSDQAREIKAKFVKTDNEKKALEQKFAALQKQIDNGEMVGKTQLDQLKTQIKQLQTLAGLTAVSGPGVALTLTDNAEMAKASNAALSPGALGIVHDYDLQQVVNEMRSAGADAISISGIRITGYTPIRCVGPVININWEHIAPPYKVEAIGDADKLYTALSMPSGIVETLRNQAVNIHLSRNKQLHVPAAESMPKLKVAKPE